MEKRNIPDLTDLSDDIIDDDDFHRMIGDVFDIAERRRLTPDDVLRALAAAVAEGDQR